MSSNITFKGVLLSVLSNIIWYINTAQECVICRGENSQHALQLIYLVYTNNTDTGTLESAHSSQRHFDVSFYLFLFIGLSKLMPGPSVRSLLCQRYDFLSSLVCNIDIPSSHPALFYSLLILLQLSRYQAIWHFFDEISIFVGLIRGKSCVMTRQNKNDP